MTAKPSQRPATPTRAENADALGVPPVPTELEGINPRDYTAAQRDRLNQLAADRFYWLASKLDAVAKRSPTPLSSRTLRQQQQDAHDAVAMLFFAMHDMFADGAPKPVRTLMAALNSLRLGQPHPLFARNSQQFDADEVATRQSTIRGVAAAVLQHLVDGEELTQREAAKRVAHALAKTQFKTGERESAASGDTIRGWYNKAINGDPGREPLAAHFNSTLANFRAKGISTADALKALAIADEYNR